MIKLPGELSIASEIKTDVQKAFCNGYNLCLAEVKRINATAQPVSDGCKVPHGWKLVPIEPTEEMMRQGFEEMSDSNDPEFGICLSSVYRRILEAAPGGQDD